MRVDMRKEDFHAKLVKLNLVAEGFGVSGEPENIFLVVRAAALRVSAYGKHWRAEGA